MGTLILFVISTVLALGGYFLEPETVIIVVYAVSIFCGFAGGWLWFRGQNRLTEIMRGKK